MRYVSESVIRVIVGDRTVDEVITIGRQEIETGALTGMRALSTKSATRARNRARYIGNFRVCPDCKDVCSLYPNCCAGRWLETEDEGQYVRSRHWIWPLTYQFCNGGGSMMPEDSKDDPERN